MADSKISPASPQLDGPSYLSDLPTELLHRILEFTLPQGLTLSFHTGVMGNQELEATKVHDRYVAGWTNSKKEYSSHRCWRCGNNPLYAWGFDPTCGWVFHLTTSPFYVNKRITSEARDVLLTGNMWGFSIDSDSHHPDPNYHFIPIFGPFHQPHQAKILRDLQCVQLKVEMLKDGSPAEADRRRGLLQYFVDAFHDDAEHPDQNPLLHTLEVRITGYISLLAPLEKHKAAERENMFMLEGLSGLKRQLKKVTVEGPPSWFAQCLVLHLTGRGGPPVSKLSWPTKIKRRKITHVPSKQKWKFKRVSTRKDWQPTLDWREYALRNGIELPDDIDRYFPPSK